MILLVLDGWGWRPERDGNAIALARTPVWDRLVPATPTTLLEASGLAVGLPEGQMGNSEVGHLNLGAGRVVTQDLVRINQSIERGEFEHLPPVAELARQVRSSGGTLHLVGLLGPGGVHAIDSHLIASIRAFVAAGVPRIAIHGFLDGRDSAPMGAARIVARLLDDIGAVGGGRTVLGSLIGRYYAMDRDRRWQRTQLAHDLLVGGAGKPTTDPVAAINESYAAGVTDEFVQPIVVVDDDGNPVAPIRDGDGVFCFNYRSDRMRQIVASLCIAGFDGFDTGKRPATTVATMTSYDQTFPVPAAFPPLSMSRILAEELSNAGLGQFRTAETEKYPHVTYFFNGGNEVPWPGEERELVASQQVATYDLRPEMSARGITDTLVNAVGRRAHEFYLCNLANADMVGHTGVMPAVISAVECIDECLGRIITAADVNGVDLLVTADHGNAEMMIDPATGGPHTAHTSNLVPLVGVGDRTAGLGARGALCDVAPTILQLLGLEQPAAMTGRSLLQG
ncbi:MAG TPA: 2,3-bisphosphoglycerate-independent phosphoglycerate mutase [Gemmatimonadales bacterium]|nr:2,3-bisphosphoglycerate-independent phosphoglycerate mutase [Gemmatimonadales bacterium]